MTRGKEFAVASAAALAYVALLVAISAALGVFGIARNDDWSFIENAFRFQETGIVAVGGWVQMNLIGQLVLAAPFLAVFGESITVLQILGIIAVGAGVLASYALARSFLQARYAVTIALTTAVSPVILVLSASFMTDGFAMAGQVAALAIGACAASSTKRSASLWWWLALAVGVWAFSIREFSIVALGALVLLGIMNQRFSRSLRIASAMVPVVFVLAILAWRSTQVTETSTNLLINISRFDYWGTIPLTVGFLALPVLTWIQPIRVLRNFTTTQRVVSAILAAVTVVLIARAPSAMVGNYFGPELPYAVGQVGNPNPLYPALVWWGVLVLASVGALIGLIATVGLIGNVAAVRTDIVRRWTGNPGLFLAAIYSAGFVLLLLFAPLITDVPLFDRYFIGLLAVAPGPLVWWAVGNGATQDRVLAPALALIALAIIGVATLITAGRVDAARWELAEEIHRDNAIARGNIDGGFDWFRFQTNGIPRPDDWAVRYSWWTLDDDRAVCVTVAFDAPPKGDPAAYPGDDIPTLGEKTVRLLFSEQVIVAKQGPDQCE